MRPAVRADAVFATEAATAAEAVRLALAQEAQVGLATDVQSPLHPRPNLIEARSAEVVPFARVLRRQILAALGRDAADAGRFELTQ